MEESNSKLISTEPSENESVKANPVAPDTLGEKPDPSPVARESLADSSQNTGSKPLFSKVFKDAVDDAQYLVAYAAIKTTIRIEPETIATLVAAKHLVDRGQNVDAQLEANFWTAYQHVCDLVKPITLEGIKAMSLKSTFVGKLVDEIPGLSRWMERRTTSKARKTVNSYIALTIFVLILVLIFQIYWVIGNQLSVQLDKLGEAEKALSAQINENSQQTLQKDLDVIKSQLGQTSVIFLDWSKPWKGLITKVDQDHSGKYASKYADINAEIAKIDDQLSADPEGIKAAENDEKFLAQLRVTSAPVPIDQSMVTPAPDISGEIAEKLGLIDRKSSLDANLKYLDGLKQNILKQIEEQKDEKRSLEVRLEDANTAREAALRNLGDEKNGLTAQLAGVQAKLDELALPAGTAIVPSTNELAPTAAATQDPAELQILLVEQDGINARLKKIDDEQNELLANSQAAFIQAQITAVDSQLSEDTNYVPDTQNLVEQLENSQTNQAAIQEALDKMIDPNSTLATQLLAVDAARETIQGQINSLQSQIESKQISIEKLPEVEKKLKEVGDQIVAQWKKNRGQLVVERETLNREEEAEQVKSILEDPGPAQLAGRFVLDILQGYLLPLLYGILGAVTYVLRSLTRQIKSVIYSEVAGMQHLSHISLGALAGILGGWFSFLIPTDSVIGSVSPLAVAFLIGYNIELIFAKIDEIIVPRIRAIRQNTLPSWEIENQKASKETRVVTESSRQTLSASEGQNQTSVGQTMPTEQPMEETSSGAPPATEGAAG